jgi:hypothetical protein
MIEFPMETIVRCSTGRSWLVQTYEIPPVPGGVWVGTIGAPASRPTRYVVGAVVYEVDLTEDVDPGGGRTSQEVYEDPLAASVAHWRRVKLIQDYDD